MMVDFFRLYIKRNELDHSYLGKGSMKDAFLQIPKYCQAVRIRNYFDEDNESSKRKYSNYISAFFGTLKKVLSLPPPLCNYTDHQFDYPERSDG